MTTSRWIVGIFTAVLLVLFGCEGPDESLTVGVEQNETMAELESGTEIEKEIEETEETEEEQIVYLPLENNIVHHAAPLFREPLEDELTAEPFAVLAYYNEDEEIQIESSTHEWITLKGGSTHIPSWYWTEAATNSELITPIRLIVDHEAPFHLYPESQSNWSYEELEQLGDANGGDLFSDPVALFHHEEWYGVMFLPFTPYVDNRLLKPVLLWLHESDIQKHGEEYDDLLSPDTELPIDTVRGITEIVLLTGTPKETVGELLGEPHLLELSRSLNYSGDPLRVGEDWRYELEEAHFIVTIFDEVVEEWEWILPLTEEEQLLIRPAQYPNVYKYEFRPYPIVPSVATEMAWQNQGDIAYAYLWEATEDVLILRGHDGGISGFHHESNIYAVDRHTGEKLWQIDAGFEGVSAVVSSDKQYVTISTSYNPVKKEYEGHVRHMRISDGEIVWEQKLSDQKRYRMTGTKDTVILHRLGSEDQAGEILALDAATGNTLWEKTVDERFEILNEGAKEPYLIIRQQQTLEALDPHTGEVQWSVKRNIPQEEHKGIFLHSFRDQLLNPFNKERKNKWVLLGNERLLIDLASGKIEASYTVTQDEYSVVVDDRYWLIQRSLDELSYSQSDNIETILYDVKEEKKLWSLPGRGSGAVIENGIVYLILDGVPAAVKLNEGSILWQMDYDDSGNTIRYYFFGALLLYDDYLLIGKDNDLLVIRKDNGALEYRVQNVKYGYPEMYGNELVQMISRDEQYIYVGSNNGIFSKMKLKEQ